MEEPAKKRRKLVHRQQQLGDVPEELIQRMQLELPSTDAARSCILSKSWLHALSTSPAIRFCPKYSLLTKKPNQRKYMRWIHLTLLRYRRHSLPITSLDLHVGTHETTYPSAKILIRQAISFSNTCLKHLRFTILPLTPFTFPYELFSCENLTTVCLRHLRPGDNMYALHIGDLTDVRCTNLRVLDFSEVAISRDVLDPLLSKNKLLEKIVLKLTSHFDEIKLTDFPFLREVVLCPAWVDVLEFDHVPSLRSLLYHPTTTMWDRPSTLISIPPIQSLRELELHSVHLDDAFSNMIKSNFPFLEELTLGFKQSSVNILDITCLTLRKLILSFSIVEEITVQVHAPNLLTCKHTSSAAPLLLFTATPPEQIHLSLSLGISIDERFFLHMRQALRLSTKFNIEMKCFRSGVSAPPFNINAVKKRVPYPATNVEELLLQEHPNDVFRGDTSLLLDAVFSICHPLYAKTNDALRLRVANYFLNLISRGVMENCEIRNPLDGRWVALTISSLRLLHTTTPYGFYEFRLGWCFFGQKGLRPR